MEHDKLPDGYERRVQAWDPVHGRWNTQATIETPEEYAIARAIVTVMRGFYRIIIVKKIRVKGVTHNG